MKTIEILKLNRISLEMLQKACIKMDDLKYVDLYDDYQRMVSDGEKKTYIVALLIHKYHISERQFYYLIKKFNKDCKFNAG